MGLSNMYSILCVIARYNLCSVYDNSDFTICSYLSRKWQKNTMDLHCWLCHGREVLNGIHVTVHVAVAYKVTNRKLTIVGLAAEHNAAEI